MHKIKVLLIEDDPMVLEVNRQFIERVEGFQIIDTAKNGMEGLQKAKEQKPDLIILDIFMPEQDGIDTLKAVRAEQLDVDIIVITAANDKATIKTMLQNGALDYIVKPFQFERLQQALQHYYTYRNNFKGEGELEQQHIDALIPSLSSNIKIDNQQEINALPKGLNEQTLKQIVLFLIQQEGSVSAEETAGGIGIARVTARRYLDFLQKTGKVDMDIQYGGVGRPINRYIISDKSS
ncbi:two-component system response regulator DctR [Salirhabdus euzebyi]|uniref:Two-component system response regulator DctR n=2 Tax=Salirhabdus euzebyi TaxID=394506 RepID=A0A841Q557_9BACI|nr:two-component system response regulator DctR [Salirhabdus euzebyi]